MKTLKVELGERSYPIHIGEGSIRILPDLLKEFSFSPKAALVSNPTVFNLYGETVMKGLEDAGLKVELILIPDGEEYKDFLWAYHILSRMLRAGLDRKSCLFALGGGVIGDIAGFSASTYMRGISYVQIPTTLLSQVDSSVGGKTGVNHPIGKNMIGTFYQPRLVLIDPSTLRTLPEREFLAGMAEVVKYGVIRDSSFFDYLRKRYEEILNLNMDGLEYIIENSCRIKADVVSEDEREAGLRAILNYGHTIGHAIETATSYRRYLHGEAVSIGMVAEARIAVLLGLMKEEAAAEIENLLQRYGLPVRTERDLSPDSIIPHLSMDKKAVSGVVKYVLPERIGEVKIHSDIPEEVLRSALSAVMES